MAQEKQSSAIPLLLVTSLFFFWGFVHNLDPILIPHLRKAFSLSYLQSSLVDSAVFIAYFVMALPAGMLMKKYGYKSGIITGLMLFGVGSLLFLVAADTRAYIYFLGALFVIASGLTMLETAANPYVTVLGPPETAIRRLNFAQSFNGLAVVIAPLVGGSLILTENVLTEANRSAMSPQSMDALLAAEASSVKIPYLVLGLTILAVAVVFMFVRLPEIKEDEDDKQGSGILRAWRHRHLRWAVLAQFVYVGAQVCVSSFFINAAVRAAQITQKEAAVYLGLGYGLAFMIGRFAGTFLMKYVAPNQLLARYAAINVALSLIAIFGQGMITVYALIGIAFFMSIMFPTIFSLGIQELGSETKTGSSLIIMAIVGGALLPPLMGYVSDVTGDIQKGYFIPMVCFSIIYFYALKGSTPESLKTV